MWASESGQLRSSLSHSPAWPCFSGARSIRFLPSEMEELTHSLPWILQELMCAVSRHLIQIQEMLTLCSARLHTGDATLLFCVQTLLVIFIFSCLRQEFCKRPRLSLNLPFSCSSFLNWVTDRYVFPFFVCLYYSVLPVLWAFPILLFLFSITSPTFAYSNPTTLLRFSSNKNGVWMSEASLDYMGLCLKGKLRKVKHFAQGFTYLS